MDRRSLTRIRYPYFDPEPTSGITHHRRTLLAGTASSLALPLAGCASDSSDDTEESDPDVNSSTANAGASKETTATIHTSEGDIDVELYGERAPQTVANFVGLATGERAWVDPETGDKVEDEPLYDNLRFHRVSEGFMIQTGDPTGTGRGGPGYTFDDEFHEELRHDEAGVLPTPGKTPMARSSSSRSLPSPTSTISTPSSARSLPA